MKKNIIFLVLLFFLVGVVFVGAVDWGAVYTWNRPDTSWCPLGLCLGGLTVPEYILLNGNLSVSGDASIDGDVEINGSLDVLGNSSINLVYAEIWNYTSHGSPFTFDITADDVYFNMTGFVEGDCNGFSFTSAVQGSGGSYFTNEIAGLYKVCLTMSFNSNNVGGTFGIAVVQNFDVNNHRDCYSRRAASTDVAPAVICCLLDLGVGDVVNVQVENEDNTRDMVIHTMNLNLVRVGA